MEKWMFICLLIRKQGSGHSQQFQVLVASTFDDIENEIVSKEGEEIGGEEFQYHPGLRRDLRLRRLKFEDNAPKLGFNPVDKSNVKKNQEIKLDQKASTRKLDEDDWDKTQEGTDEDEEDGDKEPIKAIESKKKIKKRVKKVRPFRPAADNSRIVFNRKGSFMLQGSVLDVGFALGDYKSTTADFVGSLYGSNFYKWYTFPMSKVYNFYMMEDNPYHKFGLVKNWAISEEKTSGTMVYQEDTGYMYPFHDDYTYFGGDTFMEAILAKGGDNPNIANTLISGVFDLSDNLEYWRMTHSLETNFTKPLFNLKMANGTEVLRIDHYIEIPKYKEEFKDKYYTTSKILIKALRGFT